MYNFLHKTAHGLAGQRRFGTLVGPPEIGTIQSVESELSPYHYPARTPFS